VTQTNDDSTQAIAEEEISPCSMLEVFFDPELFRALCDPTRTQLLAQLCSCGAPECTVGEIASWSAVDMSVVSRHLRTLKQAGILSSRRDGKQVLYRVEFGTIASHLRLLADAIEGCCPDAAGEIAVADPEA
jgi:DNA-binding transcriptional ArsR family regulator